jgi:hypothetical protein
MSTSKPKLLEQVRERIRLKHYSIRTEQSYIGHGVVSPLDQTPHPAAD